MFGGEGYSGGDVESQQDEADEAMELVHVDIVGPAKTASIGGSKYVIMFTDSASRLQRPYGLKQKSDAPAAVQRFIADMGVPDAFRTDGAKEFTGGEFVELCDRLAIRRETTAPNTPKQNAVVESSIWRAVKAGHAARLEIPLLYPDVHLEDVKNVSSAEGARLWVEAILWASEGFNHSATSANAGMKSPHEDFYGTLPPLSVVPFFHPCYRRVPRQSKQDPQARLSYFLNHGYNHSNSCIKVLDAETGEVCYSRDVTWHHRREPLVPAAPSPAAASPRFWPE